MLEAPTAEVPHEIEGGDSSTHGTATAPGNPKNQKKKGGRNVLRMKDERVEACFIGESTGIASCKQVSKENLEITRTQQNIASNLVPLQICVQPKSMDKSKHGKDARKKSFEKVKDEDRRKCYHCRESGRAKSRSKTRLKDLADADWKPVTANTRPSSTAADAPLVNYYVTMFLVTVPHGKRKTPCARVKIETTMRSDAGSTSAKHV